MSSVSAAWGRNLRQMSSVKRVLALVKLDVSELMRAARRPANIRPFTPARNNRNNNNNDNNNNNNNDNNNNDNTNNNDNNNNNNDNTNTNNNNNDNNYNTNNDNMIIFI